MTKIIRCCLSLNLRNNIYSIAFGRTTEKLMLFLKRFNVFFDMKSQRLGLQPINNYKRVVNPRKKRFHMSSRMNSHGKIIITKIADYEGNYVKKSGLLEGDEIIAINEIPIKMISLEEDAELSRQDTLIYDIVRQGKSYKIPVVIDKKEVQGD